MEALNFLALMPEQARQAVERIRDPEAWLLQNRVKTYNALTAADDGSGVDCPVCRNKGCVAVIPEGERHMLIRSCSCRGRRLTALRLKNCGMLERAQTCTLAGFRTDTGLQKRMKEVVEDWLAEQDGHWLAFCGQSGVGKTHLCTAAFVQAVTRRELEGEYMLWGPAVRAVKRSVLDEGEEALDRYKRAPLLYIDDLFKGRSDIPIGDADLRIAFELLDHRCNKALPTILSTERTFDQLAELDEAIAGRIRERCGKFLISIQPEPGKNYRFRSDAARGR